MGSKINKSDLGYLGPKTQKQIVKVMIENPKWLSVYLDCIKKDKSLFTEKYLDKIVEYTKDIFESRGTTPSYSEIAGYLKTIISTEEDYDIAKNLVKELKGDTLLQDIKVGEETGISALRKAEALCLLDNVRKKIETMEGYNETLMTEVSLQISNLNKVSNATIEDVAITDIFEKLCEDTPAQKIPTGIPELDTQLNGGIPKGQLALLIAGTGVGKSTLGSIICNGAALQGCKVLQIFFEDSKEDIARKHLAQMTAVDTKALYGSKVDELKEEMSKKEGLMDALKNNLRLVRMENGETTVESIRNYINNKINCEGWKPDMIFIDYLSCLLPSDNKNLVMTNEWQVWERCMKKLEVLAKELNITVWVAQQTNRYGMQTKTANERMANIQGSFRAIQPCSFVLYLDRTMVENGDYNRANLYLDKCRGCQQKEWENIYLNNGTCQIDLSEKIRVNEEFEFNE